MFLNQIDAEIRCEWGQEGLAHLLPISDVIVIVDVISFTTCVDMAVARGAFIYPSNQESAEEYAAEIKAELAGKFENGSPYHLSPASLQNIPAGIRLVLPSLNGGALSRLTGETPTLAGCLRNRAAIGQAACKLGKRITLIPAGERWENGGLRPAIEDLVGAGAIIDLLPGLKSPEAEIAVCAFQSVKSSLPDFLRSCSSGKEIIAKGRMIDIDLSAQLDVSDAVPVLYQGAYQKYSDYRS